MVDLLSDQEFDIAVWCKGESFLKFRALGECDCVLVTGIGTALAGRLFPNFPSSSLIFSVSGATSRLT